ncbi:hypothetical protein CDAR_35511 [Caerostris darwini]|uniref:Uncharacterized protein n=1 Tax=Caerostris darwini TaxID=1538125 RepID=A0AAV4SMC7_9ARAC|nr:hypothetical protein CDAR_35511 [Caerostris darwini]
MKADTLLQCHSITPPSIPYRSASPCRGDDEFGKDDKYFGKAPSPLLRQASAGNRRWKKSIVSAPKTGRREASAGFWIWNPDIERQCLT